MSSITMTDNKTFLNELARLVGHSHLLTDPAKTARYRKGFRSGQGDALAVVFPGSLLELWRVLNACVNADKIILMQAANTGLTEGSTPNGNDYDRDIVIISTQRLDKLHLLDNGQQVLAWPGTTLYVLEKALKPLGREPHSVIGSSCIGASVIGGICNNSGGSLVQRGPAYTEMSLFARIDEQGKLQLVNHLGIDLGHTPEQILSKLDDERIKDEDVRHDGRHAHDHDYVTRVRDINADTPARYNAFLHDIVLMKNVAHKVTVIEFMYQLAVDFRRQMLEPVGIVAAQGDIQRQDIFHFISVYGLITNRCASSGEAVQEGFAAFFRRTGEETALSGFKKFIQPALRFCDAVSRHF